MRTSLLLSVFAGKKDTPVAAVQEVTHAAEERPQGLDRVAAILAGRLTLPVLDVNGITSRGFHTSRDPMSHRRSGSWRSFATDGLCR